jgi:hypothetical protein
MATLKGKVLAAAAAATAAAVDTLGAVLLAAYAQVDAGAGLLAAMATCKERGKATLAACEVALPVVAGETGEGHAKRVVEFLASMRGKLGLIGDNKDWTDKRAISAYEKIRYATRKLTVARFPVVAVVKPVNVADLATEIRGMLTSDEVRVLVAMLSAAPVAATASK